MGTHKKSIGDRFDDAIDHLEEVTFRADFQDLFGKEANDNQRARYSELCKEKEQIIDTIAGISKRGNKLAMDPEERASHMLRKGYVRAKEASPFIEKLEALVAEMERLITSARQLMEQRVFNEKNGPMQVTIPNEPDDDLNMISGLTKGMEE